MSSDNNDGQYRPASWKPEVIAGSDPEWRGNALRFATQDEAARSARDLGLRWLLVREHRAAPSDDPVNYRYTESGELIAVSE